MSAKLSTQERTACLNKLPEWRFDEKRSALFRKILFEDFASALTAMLRIGIVAERLDHHPEWSNTYNSLEIWLTTHDVNGVSKRDVNLAREIDSIALQFLRKADLRN